MKNVLVIALPVFGDVLVCTPLLAALRREYPDADIDVLVRNNVGGVLEGNPDLTNVIEVSNKAKPREILRLVKGRFRRYDLVISNSASDRAMIYSILMGRKRIFRLLPDNEGPAWKRWLSAAHAQIDGDNRHALTETNELGRLAGLDPDTKILVPNTPGAAKTLAAHLGDDWQSRRFAVIHPCAAMPYKNWHADGWRTVVDRLRQLDLEVVVTGGPGEGELDYIHNELGMVDLPVTLIAGKLTLGEVSTLIERAQIYVGVDTLVTHLAAAVGTPTVALYGPTTPVMWGPWPKDFPNAISPYVTLGSQRVNNVSMLQGPGDCVPCMRQGCLNRRESHSDCLLHLPVQTVTQTIDLMLSDPEADHRDAHREDAAASSPVSPA